MLPLLDATNFVPFLTSQFNFLKKMVSAASIDKKISRGRTCGNFVEFL